MLGVTAALVTGAGHTKVLPSAPVFTRWGFLGPGERVWPPCGAGGKYQESMPPGASLSRGGQVAGLQCALGGPLSAACSARSRGGSLAGPSPVAHGGPVPPVTPSLWAFLPSLPQFPPLSYFPDHLPNILLAPQNLHRGPICGGTQMKTGMKVIVDMIMLNCLYKLCAHTVTKLKDLLNIILIRIGDLSSPKSMVALRDGLGLHPGWNMNPTNLPWAPTMDQALGRRPECGGESPTPCETCRSRERWGVCRFGHLTFLNKQGNVSFPRRGGNRVEESGSE